MGPGPGGYKLPDGITVTRLQGVNNNPPGPATRSRKRKEEDFSKSENKVPKLMSLVLKENHDLSDKINLIKCSYLKFELLKKCKVKGELFPIYTKKKRSATSQTQCGQLIKRILRDALSHQVDTISFPRNIGKYSTK